jgi:D-inositol-3-phosphate glycosyltransferase
MKGLRWRLEATRRLWRLGVEPSMPFLEPPPAEELPMGSIDGPVVGDELSRGPSTFKGWIVFPSGPTSRVEVLLGEQSIGFARLGLPRPDLSGVTVTPNGPVSGFDITEDLADWPGPDGDTLVRAIATSAARERFECEPIPITISKEPEAGSADRRLRAPPSLSTGRPDRTNGLSLLVCTHQLNLGGAQLYLLDLLRELVRLGDVIPTVVSAMDGELRTELEELGIPVHISSMFLLDDVSSYIGHVEELAVWAAERDFDIAFINTATALAFPGAEVAKQLGIPAVWAIHESLKPSLLWSNLDPAVRRRAEMVLADAASLIFEAEATQRLFEPIVGPDRCLTLPYGLDLEPIDAERTGFDRGTARLDAGVPLDAKVVLCVGTVEPRKAQVPLAQAFELIATRHPSAHLFIVGGRDDPYSRSLEEYIAACGSSDRIDLVPITPDVQPWYALSDILVCASDIESLPRTVLEAMAWETPVLATNVFGLPELIEDEETGWLCQPRDIDALAEALDRALSTTDAVRTLMGKKARILVERRHAVASYGHDVTRLLQNVSGVQTADDSEPSIPNTAPRVRTRRDHAPG